MTDLLYTNLPILTSTMNWLLYLFTSKHSRVLLWLSVPDACGMYFPQDCQAAYISSWCVNSTCEQIGGVNRMGFNDKVYLGDEDKTM